MIPHLNLPFRRLHNPIKYLTLASPSRLFLQSHIVPLTCPYYIIDSSTRCFSTSRRTLNPSDSPIIPFKLHDIGEGITEVEVLKWHVKEGDVVEEFDKLCEVQSDKSVVELTSPTAGVVHSLKIEAGETIAVGQILCDIHTGSESNDQASIPPLSSTNDNAQSQTIGVGEIKGGKGLKEVQNSHSDQVEVAEEVTEELEKSAERSASSTGHAHDTSNLRQEEKPDPGHDILLGPRDGSMDQAGGARFSGEGGVLPSPSGYHPSATELEPVPARRLGSSSVSDPGSRKVLASPAIRTLAVQLGVDLAEIRGTGEGGRIVRSDVESAGRFGLFDSDPVESGVADMNGLISRDEVEPMTRVEFGRTRKVMWKAMSSMGAVPHFGYTHTLNLTNLVPYMQALNSSQTASSVKEPARYLANDIPSKLVQIPSSSQGPKSKTSILSILVKTMVLAMEEHPIIRARVKEGNNGERWLEVGRDGVIGIAVSDIKHGLLTPSLPPLHPSITLREITNHLLTIRRNPTRPSPQSRGLQPTLTISSIGSLGEGRGAMPVLPPGGGLAICAVGRARWESEWRLRDGRKDSGNVWEVGKNDVEQGGCEAVLRCSVGWSGDHRVLEGAELIAFTETWKRYIEEPWRWLKLD